MEPIILASSSPRRQEILKNLNIPFRVIIPNINETITDNTDEPTGSDNDSNITNTQSELNTSEDKFQIPEKIAKEKVFAVINSLPPQQEIPWVLGADTLIFFNNQILGNPQDNDEAFKYIKMLQGKTHTVVTSVVLYKGKTKETKSKICKTNVTFTPMTDEEIQWYIDTGEWHGAAGGYRIQGMASCFISKIEGSYSCVVGLPISDFYDILKEQGYNILN